MRERSGYNKAQYDEKRRTGLSFQVGDQVLVKSFPLSNLKKKFSAKLAGKFKGPFQVVKQLTPLNYLIKKSENCNQVVHVDQIKKFEL